MSFQSVLDGTLSLKVNLIVEIITTGGSVFFSKNQPDSGIVIDSDKDSMVSAFKTNPTQIDLRTSKQSVNSSSVKIIDKDNVFSNFLGVGLEALIGWPIKLYVGLNTGSFDFADYILINEYVIKSIGLTGDIYTIQAKSLTDRIQDSIYQVNGNLDSTITDIAVTLDIATSTDTFQSFGRIKVNDEFMQYTGKSFLAGITTLTGLSRGDESSVAVTHEAGARAFQVERIIGNPIDILLNILLSTSNGTNGHFDILLDGVGIGEASVNVTAFTDLRDQFFPSDSFELFLYDISNALKFIEVELLQANNLRIAEEAGLLSISILDQSVPGATLPIVDEEVILAQPAPAWKLTENQIVNEFDLEYFFVEGTKTYAKTKFFEDTASKAIHGTRRGATLKFKGIQSDIIAEDRGTRFLNRFKTPSATISTSQFLKTYDTKLGGKVNFTHSDLPSPGGGKGLNNELELLKKSIDYASGSVKATYVFTSYRNVRRGLIAPSSTITTVISGDKIVIGVGRGALYKVGWFLQLYAVSTNALIDPIVNKITNISGDTLTFENSFTGALPIVTQLRFADYNNSSDDQTSRYAYIVQNSGLFADGSGGYQIF